MVTHTQEKNYNEKVVSKKDFLLYKQIKKANPELIMNVKHLEALGFSKTKQRILKTSFNRLNHLYFKQNESEKQRI